MNKKTDLQEKEKTNYWALPVIFALATSLRMAKGASFSEAIYTSTIILALVIIGTLIYGLGRVLYGRIKK